MEAISNADKNPLIIILGPTGVGKTELAIKLCQELKTEIISADSMQIYKYMDIGTAKPTPKEQRKAKHHLIDIIYPDDEYSVGDYKQAANKIIKELHRKGKIPLLVGGSGLYIKAVTNGIFEGPKADQKLRQEFKKDAEQFGHTYLHQKLMEVDHVTAQRLHPNDQFRIIRALEIYHLSGKPISAFHNQHKFKEETYNLTMIGLIKERDYLYKSIEERIDKMIKKGLVEEVKNLLDRGYEQSLVSMQGLGYKQLIKFCKGTSSLTEAVDLIKRDTRRFAKRQLTWFRKDQRINWIELSKTASPLEGIHNIKKILINRGLIIA